MAQYLQAGRAQEVILVPEVPALYVWLVDYTGLPPGPTAARMSASLGGARRSFEAPVGPYTRVTISDWITPLSVPKANVLEQQRSGVLHRWFQELTTTLQRPLYIGITGNLLVRLRQHVSPSSTLRGYLEEANIRLEHCGLAYYPVPLDLELPDPVRAEVEAELDAEPEGAPAQAGSTPATATASEVIHTLRLAEALAIRFAHPYLNRKLE